MPRPPEPDMLTFWRGPVPQCCHTCAYYSEDGYCSEFEAAQPDEFTSTFDACPSWEDIIPF